jgi:RsiW-degrading membrane proteinase PrsW (M82 family)
MVVIFILLPLLIAALLYGFIRYKYPNGTTQLLIVAFILGAVFALGALLIEYAASHTRLDDLKNLRRMAFYAFIVVGGAQEFFRFLVLRYYILPKQIFRTPADGIAYSVMIAMGMTTVMLIMNNKALTGAPFFSYYVYTAAVANLVFSVFMGFFVGLGKSRENRFIDSMTGLFAAVFFHGLYRFCFYTEEYQLLIVSGIAAVVIASVFVYRAILAGEKQN